MAKYPHNHIRRYRRMKYPAWSQSDLARRVGCTQREISKYEQGRRGVSLPMALRLARCLGQPVETLFDGWCASIDDWLGARSWEGRAPSRTRTSLPRSG